MEILHLLADSTTYLLGYARGFSSRVAAIAVAA